MSETTKSQTVNLDTLLASVLVCYPPLAVILAWLSTDSFLPVVGIAAGLSALIYLMNHFGNNQFSDDFDVYSRFRATLPWLPVPALAGITLTSGAVIFGEPSVTYPLVSACVILAVEYIAIHEVKRRELL